jgi:hypothetical protein
MSLSVTLLALSHHDSRRKSVVTSSVDAAFRPALFVNHYGSSEIYTFTTEPRAAGARPARQG